MLLVALASWGASLACSSDFGSGGDSPTEYETGPRLIDYVCDNNLYSLTGAADVTTGLSADSCGFVIGPDAGSVSLNLSSSPAMLTAPGYTEALIAVDDDREASWTSYYFDPPQSAVIATRDGHTLHVLDIRLHYSMGGSGCSLAPGRKQAHQ